MKIHHRGTENTEKGDFSLAGRRRPGKRASASGESSLAWLQPLTSSHRVTRSCPQGCDLLPDRCLPIVQKFSSLCALRVSVVSKFAASPRHSSLPPTSSAVLLQPPTLYPMLYALCSMLYAFFFPKLHFCVISDYPLHKCLKGTEH